ncbi:hypothetical protein J537_1012 [Acinetobacter baumannii 1437282]|nr:hypothetical protein J537_1012 [Acinetobacter baumannii 1437282]
MIKKSLEQKIKDVVFWTCIFFVLYLIVGYLLESNWLSERIDLPKFNDILKDSLTISAAFFAPGAAFILFTDWKEQHNKQVKNEFALNVFNQFEKFSVEIDKAGYILIELDGLLPDNSNYRGNINRIPVYLNDPIFTENKDLIFEFIKQTQIIQEEFSILLDKFRYFGIVTRQLEEMEFWFESLLNDFLEIHDQEKNSYSEFLQMLIVKDEQLEKYKDLRERISLNITKNILMELQAT